MLNVQRIVITDERVQESVIFTSFRLFLKEESTQKADEIQQQLIAKLSLFEASQYPEVQDCASLIRSVLEYPKKSQDGKARLRFQASLADPAFDEFEPLERPSELDSPITLFHEEDEKEDSTEPIELLPIFNRRQKSTSKPKSEIRRQSGAASKPKILKVSTDKSIPPSKPRTTPAVLSPELASVDLTEIIADEEAKNLPRPMPHPSEVIGVAILLQHLHLLRLPQLLHRKPHSRMQPLGDNSFLLVNAVDLTAAKASQMFWKWNSHFRTSPLRHFRQLTSPRNQRNCERRLGKEFAKLEFRRENAPLFELLWNCLMLEMHNRLR